MTRPVLYVSTFLSGSARNRSYCEDLADRLEGRGTPVIRTSRYPGRAARIADIAYTAWKHRRAYDSAIVDVFSGAAFMWAEAACLELRALGKPFVLSLHGGALPDFARRWPRRVRRLLASAARVTAPSDYMRETMRPYRSDIELVRNAVDASAFEFVPRVAAKPRLVWLRAFHAIYNPLLAVDTAAQLVAEFPQLELRMIGPDKGDGSRRAAEDHARALGVADHIEFVDGIPRETVPAELSAHDVFLNTTDIDNTPLSLLEAAAAGLCVVSTRVGGIPYLLENERDALLVPPRDPVALRAAISRVLGDAHLGERLSRSAREVAVRHDWSVVLDSWQRTLEEVGHV